jgi:hypothetical protein
MTRASGPAIAFRYYALVANHSCVCHDAYNRIQSRGYIVFDQFQRADGTQRMSGYLRGVDPALCDVLTNVTLPALGRIVIVEEMFLVMKKFVATRCCCQNH